MKSTITAEQELDMEYRKLSVELALRHVGMADDTPTGAIIKFSDDIYNYIKNGKIPSATTSVDLKKKKKK